MSPTDNDERTTRRRFLGATAALSALAVAGCASSDDGDGGAGETPTPGPMTDTPTETPATTETETEMETETETDMAAPDAPLVNYALTLEHLEHAFYRDGLAEFGEDELMNADVLSGFGQQIRMEIPEYLDTVRAHEAAHVDALSATVEDLGGTPVGEGEYDFGYETPSEFLAVAQALENTGVAAYAGAAPQVVNNDILVAAAGIHSVEARHASFLNLVNGDVPYPAGVDQAKSIDEVLEIAGQFVTSDVDSTVYETGDDRPRNANQLAEDLDLNYETVRHHLDVLTDNNVLKSSGDDYGAVYPSSDVAWRVMLLFHLLELLAIAAITWTTLD